MDVVADWGGLSGAQGASPWVGMNQSALRPWTVFPRMLYRGGTVLDKKVSHV